MYKLILLIAAFMYTSALSAQPKENQEINNAVEALRQAMINADKNTLDKLTLDNLSYGHSSGRVETKAEFIEALASGKSDFVTINLTGQTITLSGSTAVVRHRLQAETNDSGKPNTVNIGVMLVWVKQKSEWKLLARQAVKLQ